MVSPGTDEREDQGYRRDGQPPLPLPRLLHFLRFKHRQRPQCTVLVYYSVCVVLSVGNNCSLLVVITKTAAKQNKHGMIIGTSLGCSLPMSLKGDAPQMLANRSYRRDSPFPCGERQKPVTPEVYERNQLLRIWPMPATVPGIAQEGADRHRPKLSDEKKKARLFPRGKKMYKKKKNQEKTRRAWLR